MGLISGLLTLPLAPVRGVAWIGEQIAEEADRQLDDEARVRRELGRLSLEHELGELSSEEFERREDALLEELEQLHAQRRQEVIADGQ
jgi:cell division protein FtsB